MAAPRPVLSTRDQITDRLREDVFSGRLPAGERVSEAALAGRFGVSRGPIREALSLLTSEGLFLAKPNCGVTVAPPAPGAIRELVLPIRRAVEGYALRRVFDALTAEDFRYWDDVLLRMERACSRGEWQEFPQLDLAFHRYLLDRADSPDLVAIWRPIVGRMRAHFWDTARAHGERDELPRLHAHHAELLAAFRTGPKAAAVEALERHIAEN
jgi:DNA-binding GntR family transcriptional regulator